MTAPRDPRTLTWITVTLYWGCIVFGLTLPGIVRVAHDSCRRHGAWAEAIRDFRLHLFAPGYNLFLVGVLNAIPFVLLAVFILFHLGTAAKQDPAIVSRRLLGVAGAVAVAVGLSAWAHLGTTLYPDAQGALLYLFLPFYLLVLIPLGYGCGRLIGKVAAL
ncbi:MAG: hypothetical protein ABWY12_06755 [Burkholderiales bacterium]